MFAEHSSRFCPAGDDLQCCNVPNLAALLSKVIMCSHDPLYVRCHVQAIIGNYAVPILEDKQVWGTSDDTKTAYLDSQDVARMALAALRCPTASNAAVCNCCGMSACLATRMLAVMLVLRSVAAYCLDYTGHSIRTCTLSKVNYSGPKTMCATGAGSQSLTQGKCMDRRHSWAVHDKHAPSMSHSKR